MSISLISNAEETCADNQKKTYNGDVKCITENPTYSSHISRLNLFIERVNIVNEMITQAVRKRESLNECLTISAGFEKIEILKSCNENSTDTWAKINAAKSELDRIKEDLAQTPFNSLQIERINQDLNFAQKQIGTLFDVAVQVRDKIRDAYIHSIGLQAMNRLDNAYNVRACSTQILLMDRFLPIRGRFDSFLAMGDVYLIKKEIAELESKLSELEYCTSPAPDGTKLITDQQRAQVDFYRSLYNSILERFTKIDRARAKETLCELAKKKTETGFLKLAYEACTSPSTTDETFAAASYLRYKMSPRPESLNTQAVRGHKIFGGALGPQNEDDGEDDDQNQNFRRWRETKSETFLSERIITKENGEQVRVTTGFYVKYEREAFQIEAPDSKSYNGQPMLRFSPEGGVYRPDPSGPVSLVPKTVYGPWKRTEVVQKRMESPVLLKGPVQAPDPVRQSAVQEVSRLRSEIENRTIDPTVRQSWLNRIDHEDSRILQSGEIRNGHPQEFQDHLSISLEHGAQNIRESLSQIGVTATSASATLENTMRDSLRAPPVSPISNSTSKLVFRSQNQVELQQIYDRVYDSKTGRTRIPLITETQKNSAVMMQELLSQADQSYFSGDRLSGEQFQKLAVVAADIALGFIPVVNVGKDLYEAVIGRSVITGEPLDPLQRSLAAVGVLTLGGASLIAHTGEGLLSVAKAVLKSERGAIQIGEGVEKAAEAVFRKSAKAIGKAQE
ncbi:MAG TPA: pre-toxin TG domain-containing protein, partial [Pseudobdellovibrionaceae bacterium]|nr:pre-toxin TG domain-containing protein [Pseudobdellovibrionaceae bacterium]